MVPRLFEFIEDLTNWYIRLNRARFWGPDITADKIAAYSTLHTAVHELSLAMAPFAPFLAEHVYHELARLGGDADPKPLSVHLCGYPEPEEGLMQPGLEDAVRRMQQVVLLGRRKREEAGVNLRTPLRSLTIIHRDAAVLSAIGDLQDYVRSELNVKEVRYERDESRYIDLYAKPNFPVLGKRLGKRMKAFQRRIAALTPAEIGDFQEAGTVELDGETFSTKEIQVFRQPKAGANAVSDRLISIDLSCDLDEALIHEGFAREAVNRIQRSRKELGLEVSDRIRVAYDGAPEVLAAVEAHRDYVAGEVLAVEFDQGAARGFAAEIDGKAFTYAIEKV